MIKTIAYDNYLARHNYCLTLVLSFHIHKDLPYKAYSRFPSSLFHREQTKDVRDRVNLITEEINELENSTLITEKLRELIDVYYTVYGAMVQHGIGYQLQIKHLFPNTSITVFSSRSSGKRQEVHKNMIRELRKLVNQYSVTAGDINLMDTHLNLMLRQLDMYSRMMGFSNYIIPAFEEVHRVNMSKVREPGLYKVQKPRNYTPPDMDRIIREL
jgi:predicted HAD superfamily Cof-like phosphohydrolase